MPASSGVVGVREQMLLSTMFVKTWPLVVATHPSMTVINVALAPLAAGQYAAVSPAIGLAGATIAMLPVLVVFVALQKWYVKGVAGSGLE